MAQVGTMRMLERLVVFKKASLSNVDSPWHLVRGPGAAFIATAWRLNWTVSTASKLVNDEGK